MRAAQISEQQKRVVEDSGHHQVRLAIVIEIAQVSAHSGDRETVFAQRHAGFEADLLERPVALIAKQKIAHRIVGHKDVGEPVAIDIGEGDSHALADVPPDSRCLRDIGKGAVVIVVEELAGQALIGSGMAVELPLRRTAARRRSGVPRDIIRDEQVQPAIVVVIQPAGRYRPHVAELRVLSSDAGFGGNVGEAAVSEIAVEDVSLHAGDEDIGKAVVIEIADGDRRSNSPRRPGRPRP